MSITTSDRLLFEELDARDQLANFRQQFELPERQIYLNGNSLGPPPRDVWPTMRRVLSEWRDDLNVSWFRHGWLDLPRLTGDLIGELVGAAPGQVVIGDSTSVNLYKLLCGAHALRPDRDIVLTHRENFPSDLYVAEGVARTLGKRVVLVDSDDLGDAIDDFVAVVMASHVDYRTSAVLPLRDVTATAHRHGALVLWDLSHSAGVLSPDLDANNVDLAVGCGYKYLSGGPGAPAYMYLARRLIENFDQPVTGWLGHRDPFAFDEVFAPDQSVGRLQTGCPPILSVAALHAALRVVGAAPVDQVRAKSLALTQQFVELAEQELAGTGIKLIGPRCAEHRGSHISLRHPAAKRIVVELAARGVIVEYRAPDLLRCGLAPLYVRFVDVWDAIQVLVTVAEELALKEVNTP